MTRRTCVTALAAATVAERLFAAEEKNTMKEILEASLNDKKGVMLYFRGQSIAGVVTKIAGDMVELRSREYSRIMVRMEAIDGIAMS